MAKAGETELRGLGFEGFNEGGAEAALLSNPCFLESGVVQIALSASGAKSQAGVNVVVARPESEGERGGGGGSTPALETYT